MTADRIRTTDWNGVRKVATRIANAAIRNDSSAGKLAKQDLTALLDSLEEKYGPRSSIIATRADFTDNQRDKIRWWKEANDLAEVTADRHNLLLIATSLCEFWIENKSDVTRGNKWLRIMKSHLAPNDRDDYRCYRQLSRMLRKIEKQKKANKGMHPIEYK